MGILFRGINGPFSGKAGSVIGSNWKKVSYIKGLHKKSLKKAKPGQIGQRTRFKQMTDFLAPLSAVMELGFSKEDTRYMTAYNFGMSYNLKWAFKETDGNNEIDFSRIVISRGNLPKPSDARAELRPDVGFIISWSPDVRTSTVCAEDKATIVLFNAETIVHVTNLGQAQRGDGQAIINVPASALPGVWHAYIFFTSPKGNNSPNFYIGEIRV